MKTKKKLPTLKLLDLSTGHMTIEDNYTLTELCKQDYDWVGISPVSFEYGFYIPVPAVNDDPDEEPKYRSMMSDAFCHLIDLCQAQGIAVIRFDQDADVIDGLAEFDW